MKTSYFSKYLGESGVSIARVTPNWCPCPEYPALFPPASVLWEYKKTGDSELFTKMYQKLILDKLDPSVVYTELEHSILLCWEGPGKFCHRHLVAQWITQHLGVTVPEVVFRGKNGAEVYKSK